MRMCDLISK